MKYEYTSDLVEIVKSSTKEVSALKDAHNILARDMNKLQNKRARVCGSLSAKERYGEFIAKRISRFSTPTLKEKWNLEDEIKNLEKEIKYNSDQITTYKDSTRTNVEEFIRDRDGDFNHLCESRPIANKCVGLAKDYLNMIDGTIKDILCIGEWLSYNYPRNDYRIQGGETDEIEGEIYPPIPPTPRPHSKIIEMIRKVRWVIEDIDDISRKKEDFVNEISEYEKLRYTKLDTGERKIPLDKIEEIDTQVPALVRGIIGIPDTGNDIFDWARVITSLYQLVMIENNLKMLRKPVSKVHSQISVDKKTYKKAYNQTIKSAVDEILAIE